MKSHEIRQFFLEYFIKQGHEVVPSSSLIPEDDPTLLFTNAGMNQFKNCFLGLDKRDYSRATSSQKCVRAGGKHNDLENVGQTARHHTFFEMLGNFSFGDYFKKDAIHYCWELITKELQIPKDKLYVTIFNDDDETGEIWNKQIGIPKDRIYRFGEKDNFWRMGDTGPCGPCTEIFYDMGPDVGGDPKQNVMGGEGDRYVEIWNLVFMQYNEKGGGNLEPLPKPSVDTGMGLERLTAVLQGKTNNYHTDLFQDLFATAEKITGAQYSMDLEKMKGDDYKKQKDVNVALSVLADHARAAAFLIGDGVMPSNEGRGYVLRRIMRRAIRYGRNLSEDKSIYPSVVDSVIHKMGAFYPNLIDRKDQILTTTKDEEKRFIACLDQGTRTFNDELNKITARGQKTLPGDVVFKLYDTFGFPADLTRLMANEKGISIDDTGFETHMEQARQKAKASWKGKTISGDAAHLVKWSQEVHKKLGATKFVGYEQLKDEETLGALSTGKESTESLGAGETGLMAFRKTCFYAEGGGQVGDSGIIRGAKGTAEVIDCTKSNDIYIHHVRVTDGTFGVGDSCSLEVDTRHRQSTVANHSATHLMHAALRKVLGTHVTQAGSLVDSGRLRFDFTHNQPMTAEEILTVENIVNSEINKSEQVTQANMSHKEAVAEGALALFGEKYGDEVRVVTMGDTSKELCGGTHVNNTAMIRLFKIVSEGGVSAGVRRIEAITGEKAVKYLLKNTQENLMARETTGTSENWSTYLESENYELINWIDKTRGEIKKLQRDLQGARSSQFDFDSTLSSAQKFEVDGQEAQLVLADVDMDDRAALSQISDKLRDKIHSGVVIVVGKGAGSHPIIITVSKNLSKSVNAGQLMRDIASEMGGKGGGRPDFAQGSGVDRSKLESAFNKARSSLQVH